MNAEKINKFSYKQAGDIALKTLVYNSFPAHSANIPLLMLADSDQSVRSQAVDIVLALRKQEKAELIQNNSSSNAKFVRKFHIPTINNDAKFYFNMTNFD